MSTNYALIADLKQAAIAAGALEAAVRDFELDVEGYRITSRDEIPAWIERAKQEFPHRFAVQSDEDAALAHSAFVLKNLTDVGRLYTQVGEKRFAELKAQWSNGVPESAKKRLNGKGDHKTNPWAAVEGNINPKTGRFTDAAIAKQIGVVRALGAEKSAALAAAVGSRLGDLYASGFKRS
jgi:hypothetical protein